MRIVPCGTITCSPRSRPSCGNKPETTNAPAKPTSAHSPAPVAPPSVPSSKANSGGWQKRDEQRRRGKGETERGGNGETEKGCASFAQSPLRRQRIHVRCRRQSDERWRAELQLRRDGPAGDSQLQRLYIAADL